MTFEVPAQTYDDFMGRYSVPLARIFADFARLPSRGRALDVGCGTGALTTVLVERFGVEGVAAIDPSTRFVQAMRERFARVDVHQGRAEELPFPDDSFDAALAELVVHFMSDPAAGIAEMVRVTRSGGVVAACVWDIENVRAPHAVFLRAAAQESGRGPGRLAPGTRRGDLQTLLENAGCREVESTELTVSSRYASFEEWWEVTALRVGAGAQALDGLDPAAVERVRASTAEHWGDGPIETSGTAWAARGIV